MLKTNRTAFLLGTFGVLALLVGIVSMMMGQATRNPTQAQVSTSVVSTDNSGISVSGHGIISVKPDVVRLVVGTELKAPAVKDAQRLSADKSKAVSDAIKNSGVKAEDITTVEYSVRPDYIYNNNQPPTLNGYIVTNRMSIVIRDVDKAGEIIDAIANAGANTIDSISFTLDNNGEALKQARIAAMEDARKKADQLAGAGKVTVGAVVKIVEEQANLGPQPIALREASFAKSADSSAPTTIESGQFKVMVTVQVTYAIAR